MIQFSVEKIISTIAKPFLELPPAPNLAAPEIVGPPTSYQPTAEVYSSQVDQEIQSEDQRLKTAIRTPSAKDSANLAKTNQRLQAQGKPPIDFAKVSDQVESIMNNGSLSPKAKKNQIEALRKKLGLSKGEMKNLFTNRIAGLYKKAAQRLQNIQKQKITQLNQEKAQAEQLYGKNSPQAAEAQKKIEAVQNKFAPKIQEYQKKASDYKALYPSFWSKLGGFFKKIGKGLLKVAATFAPLVKFIPGIGTVAGMVLEKTIGFANKIVNKGKTLFSHLPSFIPKLLPKLF